jgi:hypothetical protein
MALTATVTPGKTFQGSELIANSKLNQTASPTVAISGTADTSQISNDSVTAAKLAFGAVYYASASGTNTITLTASGHSITLAEGMIARFKVATDNTSSVDITFGGSTKDLFRYYNSTTSAGVELAAGDLRAGQNCEIIYDGTRWQLLSALGSSQVIVGADDGGTDAYAITPSPSVRDLADITGVPVVFKANTVNTGVATLKVGTHAAKAVLKSGNVPLDTGDIKAGQWVTAVYDGAAFQLQSPVTSPSARTTTSVRQTVLACSVASTGLPNFLAVGGAAGSVKTQNCAVTPLVVAFAYGHDDSGAVDYIVRINTDGDKWTGLGGTSTYYLYVDRNVSTGAITYGQTTNRPTYVRTSTVATGDGFYTYLINTGFMYHGIASGTPIQRVFVGEAATTAGTVTSVTAYMPRGEFQSGSDKDFALTDGNKSEVHQLGLVPRVVRWVFVNQDGGNGHTAGDEVPLPPAYGVNGVDTETFANTTTCGVRYMWASNVPYVFVVNPDTTTTETQVINPQKWKLRCYASRGW